MDIQYGYAINKILIGIFTYIKFLSKFFTDMKFNRKVLHIWLYSCTKLYLPYFNKSLLNSYSFANFSENLIYKILNLKNCSL